MTMPVEVSTDGAPTATRPVRRSIGVPSGALLTPMTTRKEGGRSYIARSGFAAYAQSSHFVEALSRDVDALLDALSSDWDTREALETPERAIHNAQHRKGKGRAQDSVVGLDTCPNPLDVTSPFSVFCQAWYRLGWQYVQFTWSEHEPTRAAMYEATVREFLDRLPALREGPDAVNFDISSVSQHDARRMCGALFSLRLLQSTSTLKGHDREDTVPSGRIPVEADQYHALQQFPALARKAFDQEGDHSLLAPSDDVIFVLREMLDCDSSVRCPVFDILPPATYGIKRPRIRSHLYTLGEQDRKKKRYGHLQVSSDNASGDSTQTGLSRAMLVHSLLRERLDLPIYLPESEGNETASKAHLYRQPAPNDNVTVAGTEGVLGRRGASRVGTGLPPSRAAQNLLIEKGQFVERRQRQYDGLVQSIFGKKGLAGGEASRRELHPDAADICQSQTPLSLADIVQDARRNNRQALHSTMLAPQLPD